MMIGMNEDTTAGGGERILDLGEQLRSLGGSASPTGHHARTLVRHADLKVVLVTMSGGVELRDHHAPGSATVQVLSGRVRFLLPDREVELRTGELLVLPPAVSHAVQAREDAAFLLSLAGAGAGGE